jgi:hypothetical protein
VNKDTEQWRWIDGFGAQHTIGAKALEQSLASAEIPPEALVWKTGWTEWLPACNVAELHPVLPRGKARLALQPRVNPSAQKPPAPPVEHRDSLMVEPPTGAGLAPELISSDPFRISESARVPLPTLVDVSEPPTTPTLRPPGAVPPPPRAVPGVSTIRITPGLPVSEAREEQRDTPIPAPAPRWQAPRIERPTPARGSNKATLRFGSQEPPQAKRVPTPADPPVSAGTPPPPPQRGVKPGQPQPSAAPAAARRLSPPPKELQRRPALPTMPEDSFEAMAQQGIGIGGGVWPPEPTGQPVPHLDVSHGRYEPAEPKEQPEEPAPLSVAGPGEQHTLTLIALAVLVGVLLVAVVVLLFRREEPAAQSVPAPSVASAVPAVPTAPCRIITPAQKLVEGVELGVPLHTALIPGSEDFAIGLAEGPTAAAGYTIDPATLAARRVFEEALPSPIHGVVPLTSEKTLSFAVDRESLPLRFARTLDRTPRIVIGMADRGFAQWTRGRRPTLVWPGDGNESITDPRVADVEGVGYAITFRRGDQSGPIMFGWMNDDGSAKTPLTQIAYTGLVGTPMVAHNEQYIVVTFAGRASREAPWTLLLAAARHGELPTTVHAFAPPGLGPGQSAISPAAAGVGGQRWLLQWTEGSAGKYGVRVQTLSNDFRPLGDVVRVSPAGANAGQGVVAVGAQHALSIFIQTTGKARALWGAAMTCP